MKLKKKKIRGLFLLLLYAGHTFGFHRAEVIAAMVSVFTIWILTAFLVREAIERIKNPQEIDARLVNCFYLFVSFA